MSRHGIIGELVIAHSESGKGDLAAFIPLYDRTKDPDGIMRRFVHSEVFVPRTIDNQCIDCLNNTRNEFMHFMLMTRVFSSLNSRQ